MKKWKKTHRQRKRARYVLETITLTSESLLKLRILCSKYNMSKEKMIVKCIKEIIKQYEQTGKKTT